MNKRLLNKVAFITGGGTWIGKESARLFAAEGANVFIIGRNKNNLEETVSEIHQSGGEASYYVADISDENLVLEAVSAALSHYGKIDILLQNAGIYPFCPLEKMNLSEWNKVIEVNLTGSFIVLKNMYSLFQKNKSGRVIFISSIAGEEMGFEGFAHYSASKAGVNGLMRTAALELANYHVTVNSIDPGNIINEAVFKVTDSEREEMLKSIPLGRVGTPKDVANLALFLASDEASFITGQNFIIDGGETIT